MNQEYDNTNRGAIFREYEKKSDKHPDYKGQVNVDGKEYWVSGWKRQSKNGANYLSLSIQAKDDVTDAPKKDVVINEVPDGEFSLSDIPF